MMVDRSRPSTRAAPTAARKVASPAAKRGQLEGRAPARPADAFVRGNLFVGAIKASDVKQGATGDCFFTSALASVAQTRPELIRQMLSENRDGTVTVTFQGRNGERLPVTVPREPDPDGALPTRKGELWPALIENAYAKLRGGRETLAKGGNAADAFMALTGQKSRFVALSGSDGDQAFDRVRFGLGGGAALTATTPPDVDGALAAYGLRGQHVYSVERAVIDRGQKFIELRDPAAGERVRVPAADFQRAFAGMTEAPLGGANRGGVDSFSPAAVTTGRAPLGKSARLFEASDERLNQLERRWTSIARDPARQQEARATLRAISTERDTRRDLAAGPRPEYALAWHQASDARLVQERDRVKAALLGGRAPNPDELREQARILDREVRRRGDGIAPRQVRSGSSGPVN